MSKLLTPEINNRLDRVPVVRRLEVMGRPLQLVDEVFPGQLVTAEDIQNKSIVLESKLIGTDETVAVVDKAVPHAEFDLMVLSAGNVQIPGLANHSRPFIQETLAVCSSFGNFAKSRGFNPVVAWSYDPLTNDRPSGQGEKRFHAHLMARTPDEMQKIEESDTVIADLHSKDRRRIVEESSTVGGIVLYDLITAEKLDYLQPVEPFETDASGLSFEAVVPDGWTGLNNPRFIDDFLTIDRLIHHYDGIVRDAMFGSNDCGYWIRPELRPGHQKIVDSVVEKINLPSDIARSSLRHYLKGMQQGIITDIQKNPTRYSDSTIVHLYPLQGVSYTTCITEIGDKLSIHFRVNMFTDLGGAGISLVGGKPVKIKKRVGIMNSDQLTARSEYQSNFLSTYNREILPDA